MDIETLKNFLTFHLW